MSEAVVTGIVDEADPASVTVELYANPVPDPAATHQGVVRELSS
jgi:hypothetical protein